MQTKRMLMVAAVSATLILSACTAQSSNIEKKQQEESTQTETVQTEAVQDVEETAAQDSDQVQEGEETGQVEANSETDETVNETGSAEGDEVSTSEIEQVEPGLLTSAELEAYKPNELGEVMVVMYHGLGSKNSAYVRTPESFRADLNTYYEMGFRPVNLSDYVAGNIDVPAGYTPIVLTFDDGNKSNFNLIEVDNEQVIDPNCAVGIIQAFNKQHPDWALKGSFFVNGGIPFGQKDWVDYKLNWLVENGFEVGNHSYGHEDLTELDAGGIQKTLGRNVKELEERITDYKIKTLALPFGKRPKEQSLYNLVTSGTYEGTRYEHEAILLVGWKPEVSVYDKSFDPLAIMRVQSGDGDFQMIHWLDDYRKHPDKRFISDGNPNTITIPAGRAEDIKEAFTVDKNLVEYTIEPLDDTLEN